MDEKDRKVVNRISKLTGHLESIKSMIEREEDSYAILVQLSAVKSAVNSTEKEILKNYLDQCIESGDEKSIEDMKKTIDSFIK